MKFMLKCKILNPQKKIWENKNFFYGDKDSIKYFIENGGETVKPEEIKVVAVYELNEIKL